MKNAIKKFLNKQGYDIVKIDRDSRDDSAMYHAHYPEEMLTNKRFYNIGAGTFRHPYWTNIDYKSEWYQDVEAQNYIEHDLMSLQRINVDDDSAAVAYTSHTIEHITDEAALHLFREVYRMLKQGGTFRITCPNIDLYYRAYKTKDFSFWYEMEFYSIPQNYERLRIKKPFNKASIQELFLFDCASHVSPLIIENSVQKITDSELDHLFRNMDYEKALNFVTSKYSVELQKTHVGYHISWWNVEKAKQMLKKGGFNQVYTSQYGQSQAPILRNTYYFDNTHPKKSMYVEAVK